MQHTDCTRWADPRAGELTMVGVRPVCSESWHRVKTAGLLEFGSCTESRSGVCCALNNCMILALRKFVAVAALVALFLPVVSALAGTIAADLPACCNTNYCPLHHNSRNNSQKDSPDCPGKNMPGQSSSSVRSCDPAPNPIVGTALFVLVAPVALRAPAAVEAAEVLSFHSFTSFATTPLTPPPRAVQN